jgi:hypothetical protein
MSDGAPRTPWLPVLERPLDALRVVTELRGTVERLEGLIVADARVAKCTWAEIGSALGVTRQAAQQRHAQRQPSLLSPRRLRDRKEP